MQQLFALALTTASALFVVHPSAPAERAASDAASRCADEAEDAHAACNDAMCDLDVDAALALCRDLEDERD